MRQKVKDIYILKCRRLFFTGDNSQISVMNKRALHFFAFFITNRPSNIVTNPFLNTSKLLPMPGQRNIYKELLNQGFSQQDIHNAIYKYTMHCIECKKAYQQLSRVGKLKWHLKKYSEQVSGFFIHLTAKGLMLLKTQFAKKPKNPV